MAFDYNQKIYRLLKERNVLPSYFRDQLGRASFSIQLNIAEGSGRFSPKDRRNFLVVARSSSFECASLGQFLLAENEIPEERAIEFAGTLEEISKMLFKMISNLFETK